MEKTLYCDSCGKSEGQCEHDVSARRQGVNSQFQQLQMFKHLPGECGQIGVLGQVSEGGNKKETHVTNRVYYGNSLFPVIMKKGNMFLVFMIHIL